MNGEERRRSITQRLGFNIIGCCLAKWAFGPTREDQTGLRQAHSPAATVMNLAAALAIDHDNEEAIWMTPNNNPASVTAGTAQGPPPRMSLMKFLEEADNYSDEETKYEEEGGCDSVCCVCMGREKGAAFIPCGHTFCTVCSRELRRCRPSCPLCNRWIIDILDIY